MGHVFRPTWTKPLPAGAETITRKGERWARWTDARGRTRTARITTTSAGERIIERAATYTAQYRDAAGLLVKAATGCRSEDGARSVLSDLERRVELVRAGLMSAGEAAAANHQQMPLAEHITAYIESMAAGGGTRLHRDTTAAYLRKLAVDCGWQRLGDMTREGLERWLAERVAAGMSARSRNAYRCAAVSFANWAASPTVRRLTVNPLAGVPKANEQADRRRQRRALTADELRRLLRVATLRPLAEHGRAVVLRADAAGRANLRSRATWSKAPLTWDDLEAAAERGRAALASKPELVAELERQGRERALVYKVAAMTGLRRGELSSLTVGQFEPAGRGRSAFLRLHASDAKNRQAAALPLRADLAADLARWVADRLEAARANARASGEAIPARLPSDEPLLNVPVGLLRILERDLAAAGIPKRDDRGRTIDVHALRTTFGTHLAAAGVPLRTAQELMRHSDPKLTANVYTDVRLLDTAGAVASLPDLPLGERGRERARATGTDAAALVPALVLNHDKLSANVTTEGTTAQAGGLAMRAETSGNDAENARLAFTGKSGWGDSNSRPLDPQSSGDEMQSPNRQPVTNAAPGACTPACTPTPETIADKPTGGNFANTLAMIARLPMSDSDRAEAVRRLLHANGALP